MNIGLYHPYFKLLFYFALTWTINSVGKIFAELCNIVLILKAGSFTNPCCFELYNYFLPEARKAILKIILKINFNRAAEKAKLKEKNEILNYYRVARGRGLFYKCFANLQ
ncbi:hypothetical protein [Chryseobacterium oranimense]|uniref:hypothetical protein n=1 Tax=Chryseobacterium oranimense TaxID=421058 RepID=UPI00059594EC|nr:hypothetical protein [Chryseobacterium oranimense]